MGKISELKIVWNIFWIEPQQRLREATVEAEKDLSV